jgi:hypothetical protein
VVYTDYYGRYGPEHANYYGRSYHLDTAEVSHCCTAWVSKTRALVDVDFGGQQGCQSGVSGWHTAPVSTGEPACRLVLASAEHCMQACWENCMTQPPLQPVNAFL